MRHRREDREAVDTPTLSPFWIHVGGTSVAGLVIAALCALSLRNDQIQALGPGFWLVAGLIVAAELRPLVTPDTPDAEGVAVSSAFLFALLLHWGLVVAVLLQAIASVIAEGIRGKAWWRTTFNVAQFTLSWSAAALVLWIAGDLGTPTTPHATSGDDLVVVLLAGVAYFVVNDVLVSRALALFRGTSVRDAILEDIGYQIATTAVLFALSPLVVVALVTSYWLVPLFVLPLAAVYRNAAVSKEQERLALHDGLTGLPNRTLLRQRADAAIADSRCSGSSVCLFLLDLDRFKEINDTLGHPLGDRLLKVIGERLQGTLRPGDTIARLGGDEFAVLLPRIPDDVQPIDIARRARAAVGEPFAFDGLALELEASVGVAVSPEDGDDFETLLQRADVAMYIAKERRSGVETYDPGKDENSTTRLSLLGDLRRAIADGELELHYQPKARLIDGRVAGVEALVRWRHPTRGLVPPDDFIPAAEQSGIMRSLTRYVINLALRQSADWRARGIDLQVAVNVSMRDLHDPELPTFIRRQLTMHGVPPSALLLEITEGVLMADPIGVAMTIQGLADLGVALSLDDFGTGYSSLVHLKRLPVTEIKIDRSFVQRMIEEEEDATIVRSIIDLADALGLRVVAEGVETESEWDALVRMGCDSAQGWYLSKALPPAEATSWLEEAARNRHYRRRLTAVEPSA